MTYLCRRSVSSIPEFLTPNKKKTTQAAVVFAVFLLTLTSLAQDQPPVGEKSNSQSSQTQTAAPTTITVPAGTRIALVLTHPVQSRYVHRGDDIYAQTTSPVNSGNEVVIPAETFVQGKVEKLDWNNGRAQLRLQSLAITFPDGFVAPVSGPITLQSDEGYALKDPGQGRIISAIALPAAGAGLGALIGHSAANSSPSTITSSVPPGCSGPPPACLSSSLSVPGSTAKGTIIGAGVGAAIGGVASMVLLFSSHHFFLDVWSPVEMVVQQPITLQQNEVDDAVRESAQHS